MTYDITLCVGGNCSRRESCHRYRLYQRWQTDPDRPCAYVCTDLIADNCTQYWEEASESTE